MVLLRKYSRGREGREGTEGGRDGGEIEGRGEREVGEGGEVR